MPENSGFSKKRGSNLANSSKRRYNWENTHHPAPMTQDELLQLIDQATAEGWTELDL